MKQNELPAPAGSNRDRKRVGRGYGSGTGKTSGRGQKGQKSRTGGNMRIGFEGGQTPLIQRMPYKRGFTSPNKVEYLLINLRDLSGFSSSELTIDTALQANLIAPPRTRGDDFKVKLLGDGEVGAPLTVRLHKVSASARSKIEAAGGTVEEIT